MGLKKIFLFPSLWSLTGFYTVHWAPEQKRESIGLTLFLPEQFLKRETWEDNLHSILIPPSMDFNVTCTFSISVFMYLFNFYATQSCTLWDTLVSRSRPQGSTDKRVGKHLANHHTVCISVSRNKFKLSIFYLEIRSVFDFGCFQTLEFAHM